jgi:5-methylcytosine-specific restriction endonuclease McrA
MPFRFDASPALKQRILRRYGYECAACSNVGELTSDVAHLFEDATERRPKSDRLIVLCSNCNQRSDLKAAPNPPS